MTDERNPVGIEINGEMYEVPRLDTLDLDEERLLYLYADTVLEDFADPHPDEKPEVKRALLVEQMRRVRNPAFKRTLAHIAYRRIHPDLEDEKIQEAIGGVNARDLDLAVFRRHDTGPPAKDSQKQPASETDSNSPSKPDPSGSPIENSSGTAVVSLARTGTSG